MELSRRAALLNNLTPKDNSKRTHRKSHGNSTMSFLEMNKIMVSSWKSLDDTACRVFEELSDEGKRRYRKRLAEFEEMYPEQSKSSSSSPRSSKKAKLSSSTPKSKNPKTLARVVSDVGSPRSTIISSPYMTDGSKYVVGTPINTAKTAAARRFVTPDTSRRILPPPIAPDETVSSISYFDCLDVDLSEESDHHLLDTTEDFADIINLPVLEEGGDSSPSSNDTSMTNHDMGMMNAFPHLPLTSAAPTSEEETKKLYGYDHVQPNPQVDDFMELISSMDDPNLSFAALAA